MRPGGAAGRGCSIINLSSVAGLVGGPGCESAYSASKGAVRLVTKAAAIEAGQLGYGIRVNSVHPGVVLTPMAGEGMPEACLALGLSPEQIQQLMIQIHVIGRLGQPLDIATAIRFLACDASSWMTGSELVVDGGLTCA
jgi:NAD(P)-dependent dehydrogenase (short-subunit alcohol dehydrogenase family)